MEAVSRRLLRLVETARRSSSSVVVETAAAVTFSTGVEDTTTGVTSTGEAAVVGASALAARLVTRFATTTGAASVTGVATATATEGEGDGDGAEVAGVAGAAAVFLATRGALVAVEADIIPEDEELELILKRTNSFLCAG